MDIILNWKGKMSFEGAGESGFAQKMDSDPSVGGDDSGARPMEFIALGLAAPQWTSSPSCKRRNRT